LKVLTEAAKISNQRNRCELLIPATFPSTVGLLCPSARLPA